MKRLYTLLLVLVTMVGCKDEKSKITKTTTTSEAISEPEEEHVGLFLTFKAIVDYDDNFKLFFLDEGQKDINQKNSVALQVIGSEEPQEMVFFLNEGIMPEKLFLMFGNEQKQQRITFINTTISYKDEVIQFDKDKFFQFFVPNQFIDFDVENSIATAKEVNGKYKPFLSSRDVLIDKMLYNLY